MPPTSACPTPCRRRTPADEPGRRPRRRGCAGAGPRAAGADATGGPLPTDLAALPRRGRARHPRARAGAPPLQPHRGRRQPRPVAAADALPHGAAGRCRRRADGGDERRRGRRSRCSACAALATPAGGRGARRCAVAELGPRPAGTPIDLVVLHSISLPPGVYGGDAVERLFTNRLDWDAHPYFAAIRGMEVSAHFVIRRDGELLQFVVCDAAGLACGRSRPGAAATNCNDYSIGIELEGLEGERFEAGAVRRAGRAAARAGAALSARRVAGHEHVAPGRKHDPGAGFDWPRCSALGWPRGAFFPARGRRRQIAHVARCAVLDRSWRGLYAIARGLPCGNERGVGSMRSRAVAVCAHGALVRITTTLA